MSTTAPSSWAADQNGASSAAPELAIGGSRGNLHAFQAQLLHGVTQLRGGELWMLKRDRSQAVELVGLTRAELSDVLVLDVRTTLRARFSSAQ